MKKIGLKLFLLSTMVIYMMLNTPSYAAEMPIEGYS